MTKKLICLAIALAVSALAAPLTRDRARAIGQWMVAWSNGKQMQARFKGDAQGGSAPAWHDWRDVEPEATPAFADPSYEFRVRPNPTIIKVLCKDGRAVAVANTAAEATAMLSAMPSAAKEGIEVFDYEPKGYIAPP